MDGGMVNPGFLIWFHCSYNYWNYNCLCFPTKVSAKLIHDRSNNFLRIIISSFLIFQDTRVPIFAFR